MALRRAGGPPETPGDTPTNSTPARPRRYSSRRLGALVALCGSVGAVAMAFSPTASATDRVWTGQLEQLTCQAAGLQGTALFSATMNSPYSSTWYGTPPNQYIGPVLGAYGASSATYGSGQVDSAQRYLDVTIKPNYKITGVIVVAYPNVWKSPPSTAYYYNVFGAYGPYASQTTIDDLTAPKNSGTYQFGSGDTKYAVIKRFVVCGKPQTPPSTTTSSVPPTTIGVPPTTVSVPPTTTIGVPPTTTSFVPPTTTISVPTTTISVPPTTATSASPPNGTLTPLSSTTSTIPGLPGTGNSLTGLLWAGAALLFGGIALLLFLGDVRSRREHPQGPAAT